jgi:hypothetical protein
VVFFKEEYSFLVSLVSFLEFLFGLHWGGKSYSTVNIRRGKLSKTLPTVEGHPIVTDLLFEKILLSGCYNLKPPKPKYSNTWDPSAAINLMSKLGNNMFISVTSLTKKTAVLLALASQLRVSELIAIDFQSAVFSENDIKFTLLKPRKAQL